MIEVKRPTPANHIAFTFQSFLSRYTACTKKKKKKTSPLQRMSPCFSITSCDEQVWQSTSAPKNTQSRRLPSVYNRPVTTSLLKIRTPQTS